MVWHRADLVSGRSTTNKLSWVPLDNVSTVYQLTLYCDVAGGFFWHADHVSNIVDSSAGVVGFIGLDDLKKEKL